MRFVHLDPVDCPELQPERVRLVHEVGHAVVWFCHGEGVGRIRLERRAGLLWPRVMLAYRDATAGNTPRNGEVMAERVLAGESAARRAAGMVQDEIFLGRCPVDRGFDVGAVWADLLEYIDAERAMQVAWHFAGGGWFDWLAPRLTHAADLVNTNWAAIEEIGHGLEARIPRVEGQVGEMTGGELITEMRRLGVATPQEPAIEIIAEPGGGLRREPRPVAQPGP